MQKKPIYLIIQKIKQTATVLLMEKNIYRDNDQPASIVYYKNGSIKSKWWYKNNEMHCNYGPAYISYRKNGKIERIEYYLMNYGNFNIERWHVLNILKEKLHKDLYYIFTEKGINELITSYIDI